MLNGEWSNISTLSYLSHHSQIKLYQSLPQHTELEDGLVTFNVPKEDSEGYVNNKKDLYKFKFEDVFPEKTQQDTIFEKAS